MTAPFVLAQTDTTQDSSATSGTATDALADPSWWEGLTGAWQRLLAHPVAGSPIVWGLIVGAIGVTLMLPPGRRWTFIAGVVLSAIGLGLIASAMPLLPDLPSQAILWILGGMTLLAALATIVMRSPLYSAIWFAITLLGVGGLLLVQGAQFLGVATVVVYAGAIVVTFLFVLMLSQPEGHDFYDRISWGRMPVVASTLAAAAIVGTLTFAVMSLRGKDEAESDAGGSVAISLQQKVAAAVERFAAETGSQQLTAENFRAARLSHDRQRRRRFVLTLDFALPEAAQSPAAELPPGEERLLQNLLWEEGAVAEEKAPLRLSPEQYRIRIGSNSVLQEQHVARLGGELFGRHMIAVQLAAILLMIALVGALAIALSLQLSRQAPGHAGDGRPHYAAQPFDSERGV